MMIGSGLLYTGVNAVLEWGLNSIPEYETALRRRLRSPFVLLLLPRSLAHLLPPDITNQPTSTNTNNMASVIGSFLSNYNKDTPQLLRIVDQFTLFAFLTGIAQLVYVIWVGTFPFNAFLSGFISTVGTFVLLGTRALPITPAARPSDKVKRTARSTKRPRTSLTFSISVRVVGLRMQLDPENNKELATSPERAFGEFLFCAAVLHFGVLGFIG